MQKINALIETIKKENMDSYDVQHHCDMLGYDQLGSGCNATAYLIDGYAVRIGDFNNDGNCANEDGYDLYMKFIQANPQFIKHTPTVIRHEKVSEHMIVTVMPCYQRINMTDPEQRDIYSFIEQLMVDRDCQEDPDSSAIMITARTLKYACKDMNHDPRQFYFKHKRVIEAAIAITDNITPHTEIGVDVHCNNFMYDNQNRSLIILDPYC